MRLRLQLQRRLFVAYDIRAAVPEDAVWIKPLFDPALFWDFGRIWWRFWNQPTPNEHWDVIDGKAFVHWKVSHTGEKSVQEIATHPDYRQQGCGRALLAHVGTPVSLKTDVDNTVSRLFYVRLGFKLTARMSSRSGRSMAVYQKW